MFFVINCNIAQQVFILNSIWSILAVCEIPAKLFIFSSQSFLILILYLFYENCIQPEATSSSPRFLRPLQWHHTNTNRKWHSSFTNTAESKYEFVQLFYDIKWISSGTFEFEQIKQQTIPKNWSRYTKKLGVLSVIKQLQHTILCNMIYYGALKSNIDCGLRPLSILFFSAP